MPNLVVYKLVTSEWIVGEVQETLEQEFHQPGDSAFVVLKEPLMIQFVPKGPQSYGLALMPFDPTNPQGSVKVSRDKIVAQSMEVAKALHDAYVQQTSNIQIISSLGDVQ